MHLRHSAIALLALGALAGCAPDAGPVSPVRPAGSAGILAGGASVEGARHLVLFDTDAGIPAGFAAEVAALGGSVATAWPQVGAVVVEGLDAAGVARLGASEAVQSIGEDVEVALDPLDGIPAAEEATPESPSAPNTASFFPRQWHHRAIGAHTAWAAGILGSSAVRVFILDTGLDYTHPDLVGRVDLAASTSFVPSDAPFLPAGAHPVADLHYHGTHVGATVSSNALAAAGVTSRVTLVGVKVLGRNGRSVGSSVIDGILYAVDGDADVINMSLGGAFSKAGNGAFLALVHRTTNYAHRNGTLVVVSAGNDNIDLDHDGNGFKTYCSSSNVVCVSATGPTGSAGVNGPFVDVDAKAPYSNYGRSAIAVAAPGGAQRSVWAACSRFSLAVPVCRTGTFVLGLNGTSMASPHVSGLAALLVERLGRNNPAQVRAALAKSADDLGQNGNDPIYGAGRINVATAMGL